MPLKGKTILSFNILFLILLSEFSVAQNKYWVEINTDPASSNQQLETDFEQLLKGEAAKIVYYSTFLEAYSVSFESSPSATFSKHDLVKSIQPMRSLSKQFMLPTTAIEYGFALEQIRGQLLTDSLKLDGENIKIGVIDGGFLAADREPSLSHLIEQNRIIYFSDYLMKNNKDPFYGRKISQDDHGSEVLRLIAGINTNLQLQTGMATAADFYLSRTDHGIRENRIEEDYWVMAIESFYHMGVKLINSSLGYTNSFDRKKENHKKSEVDGYSSMITKAAEAAAQKGMLLVISAGNDGNSQWEVLSLPADAPSVLTVGATDFAEWSKMSYSSIGPEKIDFVKPNIACFANNGTSYSAPIITGLAACIWQYDSTLSNFEIIDIIERSSHLYEAPNNYIGYGVPDARKIIKLLEEEAVQSTFRKVSVHGNTFDMSTEKVTKLAYYHKASRRNVLESGIMRRNSLDETFVIECPKGARYTTVYFKDEFLLEIEWLDQ